MKINITGKPWDQYKGDWVSTTTYYKNDVVSFGGSSWVSKRTNTNVSPIVGSDWNYIAVKGDQGLPGSVTSEFTDLASQIATDRDTVISAKNTTVSNASAAAADRAAIAAQLLSFRNILLGAFANDAAAVAFAAANSITVADGLMYENTTIDKFRIYTGSAWVDYDASAQQQQAAAALSATNAHNAQIAAETARDAAITAKNTSDTNAAAAIASASSASTNAATVAAGIASAIDAKTASETARDATIGYKNTTQSLLDSVSAFALQVASNKTSAETAAASASAVSGLSNLSAAAKAIITASDVTTVYIYDTTRDTDGGAWRDKCADKSWMTEALNTATRGATAKFSQRMLIVGQSTGPKINIYDLSDPSCPLLLCVSGGVLTYGVAVSAIYALNGAVYIGGSNGLFIFDFIMDEIRFIQPGNHRINGNIASRSVAQLVAATGGYIINTAVNDISATIAPLTPLNSLRCNLPNPTVAVATMGGVSVIRHDGVIVNVTHTNGGYTAAYKVSLTPDVLAFTIDSAGSVTSRYSVAIPVPTYTRTVSMAVGSVDALAGTLPWGAVTPNISMIGSSSTNGLQAFTSTGKKSFAFGSSLGLSILSRDTANPTNAMMAAITDKYNTGLMHGLVKCAFAESNGDLSNLSANTLFTDDFSTYANTAALQAAYASNSMSFDLLGSAMRATRTASGQSSVNSVATYTGVSGKTYCIEYDYSVGTFTGTLSLYSGIGGTIQGNAIALSSGASGHASFYYTSNGGSYGYGPGFNGTSTDAVVTIDNFKVRLCASEKSGAGNHAIVNGTLTRSVVASGAELAAYDGFGAANYLSVPYAAALDIGANDFAVMAWVNIASGTSNDLVSIGNGGATWGLYARLNPGVGINVGINGGITAVPATGLAVGQWAMIVVARIGGVGRVYLNGVNLGSAGALTGTIATTTPSMVIGGSQNCSGLNSTFNGKIANFRFENGSAPTPDQIAAIYANELPMFQPNAKCLLTGSTNVQGLSYDADTEKLAIATAAGTNIFKGLTRVGLVNVTGVADAAKLNSDNHKSVAFSGGDLIITSANQVYGSLLATSGLREIAKRRTSIPAYDSTWGFYNQVTIDATPTVIASTPILEGRSYRFRATVAAVQYGGVATEKAAYDVTGIVTRDIGGNVVVVSTTTTVSEVTASMDCIAQANTTAQTLEIKGTGKSSTRLSWGSGLELYEIGYTGV